MDKREEIALTSLSSAAGYSGAGLQIAEGKLPFVERVREAAEAKCFPGGTFRNRKHYECVAEFGHSIR